MLGPSQPGFLGQGVSEMYIALRLEALLAFYVHEWLVLNVHMLQMLSRKNCGANNAIASA